MKKTFKKVSTTSLATLLAATAVVPVVAAETPAEALSVEKVIVEQEGKLIQITQSEYVDLFLAGKNPVVKYITLNSDETYTIEQYTDAFLSNSLDNDKAIATLSEKEEPTKVDNVLEGQVNENNEIVIKDEQPSEDVKVESVKAINETSIEVTLAEEVAEGEELTAEDFTVTIGEEEVEVTEVAVEGKDVTLTVALDGKKGLVTVNGVEGEEVDFTEEAKALAEAIAAAEQAIEEISDEEITLEDTANVEDARAKVDAALALDENAEIAGLEKLEAAEAALAALQPAVTNVGAEVDEKAKSIKVTATLTNIDAAVEVITVELKQKNDEGELVSLDPKIDAKTLDEDNVEDNILTATLEVKDLTKGDYVVVVTAADIEETVEVSLDFTTVDSIVDAVNKAATEIALQDALAAGNFEFKPENITEYRKALGTAEEGANDKKTVKEIQDKINEIDDNVANSNLVAELKEAAKGTQQGLLDALTAAGFEGLDKANINEYQARITAADDLEAKSDVQALITLINAEEDFKAKNAALTEALTKLTKEDEEDFIPSQEDVDAAKAALKSAEKSLEALQELNEDDESEVDAQAQTTIEAAQGKIDTAKDAAQALADAKKDAKAAQAEFVKAGGKKGATVYVNVTNAIEEATDADDLTVSVTALKATTTALEAFNEAVVKAEKSVADFLAAGGDEKDGTLEALQKALKEKVALEDTAQTITQKTEALDTEALDTATEKLVQFAESKAKAEKALEAYKAAGGKTDSDEDEDAYNKVVSELEKLAEAENTEALDTAVKALDEATEELVQVKAINDAIAKEDAVALQNIIVKLDVTEFANLTKAQRAEIGAFMIHEGKGEDAEEVTATETFKSSVTEAITSYTEKVKAFNEAANKDYPGTAEEKKAVIDAIKAVMELDVDGSAALDLAEAILEAKPETEAGYTVRTIAEIKAIVEAANK